MTRVVHCRREPYDVLIDRTTPWGNPFSHIQGRPTRAKFQVGTRGESIAAFEDWVRRSPDPEAIWIREHVHELRGKTLGCWCAPKLRCHGTILAHMAEGEPEQLLLDLG